MHSNKHAQLHTGTWFMTELSITLISTGYIRQKERQDKIQIDIECEHNYICVHSDSEIPLAISVI